MTSVLRRLLGREAAATPGATGAARSAAGAAGGPASGPAADAAADPTSAAAPTPLPASAAASPTPTTPATLPNLLLCGAQRCGTTTLRASLDRHADIGFLGEKDLEVDGRYVGWPFASPSLVGQAAGTRDVYEGITSRLAGKRRWIGVKWPYFMFYAHIPCAIREQLPDARMLFILRDPVETVHSAFRSGGHDDLSADAFDAWVDARLAETQAAQDPTNRAEWLASFGPGTAIDLSLERGLYAPQILRFARLFPREQWHVVRFEDLAAAPEPALAAVLDWLGLDPGDAAGCVGPPMNAAPRPDGMHAATRTRLAEFYATSNTRLFDLLGWDAEPWTMP